MRTSSRPLLRDQADIEALERVPLAERLERPVSSYAAIAQQAVQTPRATALTFVPTGDPDDGDQRFDYATLLARITQTANALHHFGVGREDVVSYMLPNLPETHFALWGAEAVGIVNPINPFLEVDHIAGILNAAGTRVLIAQGRQATPGIWEKVEALRSQVPSLKWVLRVGGDDACPGWARDFDAALAQQSIERTFPLAAEDGGDAARHPRHLRLHHLHRKCPRSRSHAEPFNARHANPSLLDHGEQHKPK